MKSTRVISDPEIAASSEPSLTRPCGFTADARLSRVSSSMLPPCRAALTRITRGPVGQVPHGDRWHLVKVDHIVENDMPNLEVSRLNGASAQPKWLGRLTIQDLNL